MAYTFLLYFSAHDIYKACISVDDPQEYVFKYFETFDVDYIWSLQFDSTIYASRAKAQYINLAKESGVSMFNVDSFAGEPPEHTLMNYDLIHNPPVKEKPAPKKKVVVKVEKPEPINDCPF
jgi:hypothetical protein